jgi:hypothetical protein
MTTLRHLAAATALTFAAFSGVGAQAAPVTVDVTGAQSINLQGETGNTVWLIDIGANAVLNALNWAVTLQAFSPSLLSEMQVSFGNSTGLDLITFSPDAFDGFSGAGSYVGSLDLTGLGLAAGADGLLRIEFSEAYKDFATGMAEGQWTGGSLSFDITASAVPEPASLALVLLGLGLVGTQARRRRG